MIPAAVMTAIGGYGWGWTIGRGYPIIVGEVCSAFLWIGAFWGCCGTISYANSCFPARGGDACEFATLRRHAQPLTAAPYLVGIMVLLRSGYIFGSSYIYNVFMATR